jgi:hypothetical protein
MTQEARRPLHPRARRRAVATRVGVVLLGVAVLFVSAWAVGPTGASAESVPPIMPA